MFICRGTWLGQDRAWGSTCPPPGLPPLPSPHQGFVAGCVLCSAIFSIIWVMFYLGLDFFQLISLVDLTHFLSTMSMKSLPTSCSSRCTCKYGQQSLPWLGLTGWVSRVVKLSPCGSLTRHPSSTHPPIRPSSVCPHIPHFSEIGSVPALGWPPPPSSKPSRVYGVGPKTVLCREAAGAWRGHLPRG